MPRTGRTAHADTLVGTPRHRDVRALPAAARVLPAHRPRQAPRLSRRHLLGATGPGFGDPEARLLILGLAPAAHGANRTGRVFTGDGVGGSGDFLMAALHRTGFANITTSQRPDDGLQLRDAFIAAAVRCAPPDNKPNPDEIANCLPHLVDEIRALPRVQVVVALGKIAFDAYVRLLADAGTPLKPRPPFAHAGVTPLPNGQTLIGCYHPSRQNTNTGKLTPPMMENAFRIAANALR